MFPGPPKLFKPISTNLQPLFYPDNVVNLKKKMSMIMISKSNNRKYFFVLYLILLSRVILVLYLYCIWDQVFGTVSYYNVIFILMPFFL